jgi:ATP-binding cassette subfamily G (WHITE) protein 2
VYTAELRLAENVSREEKERRADDILIALGLQVCSDTIVGGVELRGVSGGQRKRTSVGMELVTNPMGLFLDEPTT